MSCSFLRYRSCQSVALRNLLEYSLTSSGLRHGSKSSSADVCKRTRRGFRKCARVLIPEMLKGRETTGRTSSPSLGSIL